MAFFSGFVWWGEVYKSMEGYVLVERGGAARLARGAHNPEVGSSNLPPATILVCGWLRIRVPGRSLFRVKARGMVIDGFTVS